MLLTDGEPYALLCADIRMDIVDATLRDVSYIDWLRAKEGDAVGFIPKARYEMEISGERGGDIILAKENNEPVGFAYITYGPPLSAKIQQIAVQADARRMERGTALIAEITARAKRKGCAEIGARCAEDLEANEFWLALGFERIAGAMGKSVYGRGKAKLAKGGRRINVYRRLSGLYEARLGECRGYATS